jgi:hypothetical protein
MKINKIVTIIASIFAINALAGEGDAQHKCTCGKDHHKGQVHEVAKVVKKASPKSKEKTKSVVPKAAVHKAEPKAAAGKAVAGKVALKKIAAHKSKKVKQNKKQTYKKETDLVVYKAKERDYSITAATSLFSEDKNVLVEFERNFDGYSVGLLANQAKLVDKSLGVTVNNLFVGVSGHFRLVDRALGRVQYTFGPYVSLGASFTDSTVQENLPVYPTGIFGLEHSVALYGKLHLYNRFSSINIFHPDSNGVSLNKNFTFGVKFKF